MKIDNYHNIYHINHLVLEVSNGDTLLIKLIIGPGDDLALHNRRVVGVELGEEGQGVGPHQLPDQGQRQGPVTLHDVRAWISTIQSVQCFFLVVLLSGTPLLCKKYSPSKFSNSETRYTCHVESVGTCG